MNSGLPTTISELRKARRIAHANLLRDRTAVGFDELEIMEHTDRYSDHYREGLRAHLYEIDNNVRGPKAQAIYHRELDMLMANKKAKEEHLEAAVRDLMKSENAFHEAVRALRRAEAKLIKEMEEALEEKRVQAEDTAKARESVAGTAAFAPGADSIFGPGSGSGTVNQ